MDNESQTRPKLSPIITITSEVVVRPEGSYGQITIHRENPDENSAMRASEKLPITDKEFPAIAAAHVIAKLALLLTAYVVQDANGKSY